MPGPGQDIPVEGGLRGRDTLREEVPLNLPDLLGLFLNRLLSIALLCIKGVLMCVRQGAFSHCVEAGGNPGAGAAQPEILAGETRPA